MAERITSVMVAEVAGVFGKSRVIGLGVASLNNYFNPDGVEKLSNAFQKRGYQFCFLWPRIPRIKSTV